MSLSYLCPKVVTRKSEVDGRGTFAIEPIRAGEMVAMFGGHIYEVAKLQTLSPQAQVVGLSIWPGFLLGPLDDDELGDGDFVNHSCAPNCGIRGQIMLVARTDIAVGAELTFDYGTVLIDHADGGFQMDCRCGAPVCRGKVTSDDWKDPAFRARYAGYLSVAVQALVDAE